MNRILKMIFRSTGFGIGWAVLIVYSFLWVTASATVVWIVFSLLKTGLSGWINAAGWRRVYLLCGAITVAIFMVRYSPEVLRGFFQMTLQNPIEAVIAIVIMGCIPIIAIPLITAGWPFIWWFAWDDFRNRDSSNKSNTS